MLKEKFVYLELNVNELFILTFGLSFEIRGNMSELYFKCRKG